MHGCMSARLYKLPRTKDITVRSAHAGPGWQGAFGWRWLRCCRKVRLGPVALEHVAHAQSSKPSRQHTAVEAKMADPSAPLYPEEKFITAEQLAELLRGPEASKVKVVDVRGDDFAGGHVKGAVNIPSTQFTEASAVDQAIEQQIAPTGATTLVFHCAQSKQRGPRCAASLAQRLEERADSAFQPNVLVLRGGFDDFAKRFSAESDLVADFDPSARKDKH